MLIRCPQCGTGFNLDADRIPAKGAKVRCSACTHTFRVRVRADDQPEYFYKKGEAPYSGETMVGAPLDVETALGNKSTAVADENTHFGIPQRSKSAAGDYNPFPLAGNITGEQPAVTPEQAERDRNDSTQLLGSASEPEFEELDIDDLLLDDDDDDDDINDQTQLAPQGLAEKSAQNQNTQFGAPAGRHEADGPPPLRTTEDDEREANNRTQALGSAQKLDLFDGEELPPEPAGPPPIDIDPFGDAFDEPVDGGVGLLMPSTPSTDDPKVMDVGLAAPSSDVSMSEEDFLLGGGSSEFGDALSLVDNSFGDDVPAFDASSGVVDVDKRPRGRRSSAGGRSRSDDDQIELEDVRRQPAPKQQRREPETATRTTERPRQQARPAPAYVHQVGAPSVARRTADVVFITLIVVVAFLGFIAVRAGGFIDFQNFGHMLEVAFAGEEFQPREQWRTVVKIPPPDPPPDEPLRLHNVRALEKQVGEQHLLIVAGKIRNYSLEEFKGVKVRATVQAGGKTVVERVVVAGQQLDRDALGKAKSIEDVKRALQKKLPDIGKEGTTYFAIVFDDVPSEVVASGDYDYSIAVAN